MITDLIRNDLARVCAPGSVRVEPSLLAVESFATVHQLVSTVTAQLPPGRAALDAVAAAFPPGSMTGAPKVRTMRLIHELERGAPRGVYSGARVRSTDGAADLAVVIRTATVDAFGVRIGAGGAVVALSDADDEWREVKIKAAPVMRAVALCATGDANAYELADVGAAAEAERGAAGGGAAGGGAAAEVELLETLLHTPDGGYFLLDAPAPAPRRRRRARRGGRRRGRRARSSGARATRSPAAWRGAPTRAASASSLAPPAATCAPSASLCPT